MVTGKGQGQSHDQVGGRPGPGAGAGVWECSSSSFALTSSSSFPFTSVATFLVISFLRVRVTFFSLLESFSNLFFRKLSRSSFSTHTKDSNKDTKTVTKSQIERLIERHRHRQRQNQDSDKNKDLKARRIVSYPKFRHWNLQVTLRLWHLRLKGQKWFRA